MKEAEDSGKAMAEWARKLQGDQDAWRTVLAQEVGAKHLFTEQVRLPHQKAPHAMLDTNPASATFGLRYFNPLIDDPANPDGLPLPPP